MPTQFDGDQFSEDKMEEKSTVYGPFQTTLSNEHMAQYHLLCQKERNKTNKRVDLSILNYYLEKGTRLV